MPDELNPEQRDRERALYVALRLVVGDEKWDACDVIDLAEYVRTGARGLPIEGVTGAAAADGVSVASAEDRADIAERVRCAVPDRPA
jgi:hypothetical protein